MKTLDDFRAYLDAHPPETILFRSDDQNGTEQNDAIGLRLSFSQVTVGQRPNVIHLSGQNNSMTLYNVKSVEIDNTSPCIGTILRMICGSINGNHTYTFVFQ